MIERERNPYFEKLGKAEHQIAEDTSFIGSLQGHLKGVDTRVEESMGIVVADFKVFAEFKSHTKRTFMSSSKCFPGKWLGVGLGVALTNDVIKCDFGNRISSRDTSVMGVRDGFAEVVAGIGDPTAVEKVIPDQTVTPESVLEKSSPKGSS